MRLIALFLTLAILPTQTPLEAETYTLQKDDVTLIDSTITAFLNTDEKDILIPDSINGSPIRVIAEEAFKDKGLTGVSLSDNITQINRQAFAGNELTSIAIPTQMLYIQDSSFYNNALLSVTFHPTIKYIGKGAFEDNQIEELELSESLGYIKTNAFKNNKIGSVIIPNGVKEIEESSFQNNEIASLTLSNNMQKINDSAFYQNKITEVTLPPTLKILGNAAFQCNNIQAVTFSNQLTTLPFGAFADNKIASVTIPGTIKKIRKQAFKNNLISELTLEEGVEIIEEEAFMHNALTSVTLPTSVTELQGAVFNNNSLTSFNGELSDGFIYKLSGDTVDSTTVISYGGTTKEELTIPEGIVTIADKAFSETSLSSVEFPTTLTAIGEEAFTENNISSITIPQTVTTIGTSAFIDNEGLTSFTLPVAVKGDSAFSHWENQFGLVYEGNSETTILDRAYKAVFDGIIPLTKEIVLVDEEFRLLNNAQGVEIFSKESVIVSLFDARGRVLAKSRVIGTASLGRSLPAGIYYLRTTFEDGSTKVFKVHR